MMKKSRINSLFLRTLALIMAIGLLIGAIPVAAVESDEPAEGDSASSAVEEVPSQEETEFTEEQSEDGDEDSEKSDTEETKAEGSNKAEIIASKGDIDIAETAEAPSGVTIDVDEGRFESCHGYYYTGIESITISFTKPGDLPEDKIKVAFDQDLSETEDYDRVDWWDDYGNLTAYRDLYIDGNDVEIEMDIESFVDFRYNSEGFSDGKADGIYTLVFSYDIDGDDNPILYSQDFMITNEKPGVKVVSTDGNISSDSDKWVSDKGKIEYETSALPGVGVKKVKLWKSDWDGYDTAYDTSGSFTIVEQGQYYLTVVDKLDQESDKVNAGEFKIEKKDPEIKESDITYPTAAPESDSWSSDSVDVTFKVTTGGSGVKQVKAKGNTLIPNENDEYTLTFDERKDIEVTLISNAGREVKQTITAPQIDTVDPDKNSITHIGFSTEETNKILNLLTFGIYGKKELQMTVYTEDESPIKEIEIINSEENTNKITKVGTIERNGKESAQTFVIPAGSTKDDSNYTGISIKLTDLAENVSTTKISWEDVKRYTVKNKEVEETFNNVDGKIKEMVNTKLTPDVPSINVSGETSETKPDYYRNNVEITADINEPLTGIASAAAYFGTENDFTFDDETKEYTAKESAKKLDDQLNVSKKSGDKVESYRLDYKIPDNHLPTGKYLVLIQAENNSGNPMQKVKEFYVDKEAPVIKITSAPANWSASNKITFTVAEKPDTDNVGIGEVAVKCGEDSTIVTDDDDDGEYEFTPEAGKDYVITAKDLLNNQSETDPADLTYDKIKFDNLSPKIGAFKYIDSEDHEMTSDDQWSNKVTVKFTVDDKLGEKILSGFDDTDPDTFVVTKKDSTEPLTNVKPTMTSLDEGDNNRYECSFEVPDNHTAYTFKVRDIAGNVSAEATTKVINRDDTAPEIEKIVISGFTTAKEFGMYGQNSLKATVYTKSGHSAPVSEIILENNGTALKATDENPPVKDGDYYTKTFVLEGTEDGSVYKDLKIIAKSAAGVSAEKGIKSVNIYAQGVEGEFDKFLEAVAKLSGPVIELEGEQDDEAFGWKYPAEKLNSGDVLISGYNYDESGVFDGNYGTFGLMVKDPIAGVNEGSVTVYFDKVDKFTLNSDNVYEPKSDAAKVLGIDKTSETDNEEAKNTWTKCTYQPTEATPGGKYVLCVQADNLSGVTKTVSKVFNVDNEAPVINHIQYDGKDSMGTTWSKKKVKVTFDVNDLPTGINGGIKDVTVVGEKDGNSPDDLDHVGSKYTFTTDVSQRYIITAWDIFNNKSEEMTDRILTDLDAPHVTISDEKLNEYRNNWAADDKDITFYVDDIWDYDGFEEEADKKLSGIKSIEVRGLTNGTKYGFDEVDHTCDKTEYTFSADLYQDYKIIVYDNANNKTEYTELTKIKIDKIDPVIDNVSFDKKDKSTLNKLLHFLSFGIFGNKDVTITVDGTDPYASSSIQKVIVRFEDASGKDKEKVATKTVSGGDPDEATISATIDVPNELISNSKNISVEIIDNVEHTTGEKKLYDLYDTDPAKNKLTVPEGFKIDGKDFEFVITEEAPKINSIKPYSNDPGDKDAEGYGSTKTFESAHDGKYWYNKENFSIDFTAEDTVSKLHSIDVAVNNNDITDKCYEGGTKTQLEAVYTNFNKEGSHNDQEVPKKDVTVDASNLSKSNLNYVSQGNSANVFSFTATGNNGIPNTVNAPDIYIDNVAPDITAFSFADTVDENSREKVDETEKKEISEALADAGSQYHAMTSDNYIYFFQDEAQVTISATDTHSGVPGSGVREIHFYAVGKTNVDSTTKVVQEDKKIVAANYGNMSATFTIPAGFKGSIFAYAVDQVKNYGSQYSPNNLVVENRDIHDSSSDVDITINTESVGTDNNGHPLYDGDVSITFTVEDEFSGIRSVSYSCIGLEDSAVLEGSAFVDGDGDVSDDLGSWTVNETDKNLVLNMSRSITLDGDGAFNSNNIVIRISGYDCSGYAIAEETKTISIDTTKPVIEVSYSPVKGSGNTYGSDIYEYYKENRTMNVTVYERNFDPSGFDYSGIVNKYVTGDVPGLSAGDNWDTDYSDYTDDSSHTCSFTFANDGDYEITLNCTDEAGNKADEYEGEKFTIDTIDPTVEVSLSGTAKNGKYYNETVTATVTVHEHNFAEGDTYVTFTPKTDFDTSYDKSSSTPSISGWSGSGDTHTTTIDFSSDGTYSFTFDYKDKALRSAQQFSQTEFVVDKNIDKLIKFIDVTDTTAYDGKIAPKVSFDDTNLDTATSTLTRISMDTTDMKQSSAPATNLKHAMAPASGPSRTDSYENFPVELVNDGIYEFEASGTDMAGNSKSEKILFSVNRFGSTFMLSSQSREWIETGYVNQANQLDVIEINVNEVKNQSVSVTRNSHTETLKNDAFKLSSAGDNENWYRYNYNVYDSNFTNDGEYTVTVSSVDTFKKSVSNRTAVNDEEKGIEKNCPISFVMDTDVPIIEIDGVESDTPYGDPEKTVNIICADANIEPESLVIKDGDDELVNGTDYTMEELAGELDIELVVDRPGKHTLTVFVADKATNNSTDEVANFELNASIFTLFFHNTVAVICTAVGLAALIVLVVFLILKKKKKEEDGKATTAAK